MERDESMYKTNKSQAPAGVFHLISLSFPFFLFFFKEYMLLNPASLTPLHYNSLLLFSSVIFQVLLVLWLLIYPSAYKDWDSFHRYVISSRPFVLFLTTNIISFLFSKFYWLWTFVGLKLFSFPTLQLKL